MSVVEPSCKRSVTPRISREPGVVATPDSRTVWKPPGPRAMGCGLVTNGTPVVLSSDADHGAAPKHLHERDVLHIQIKRKGILHRDEHLCLFVRNDDGL